MNYPIIAYCFFFLAVFCSSVDGFACPAKFRSCLSTDTKCIYEGYKLRDEERFRLRTVTTKLPGPEKNIPVLFDGNQSTIYHTGARPSADRPVAITIDLGTDYYLSVLRFSFPRPLTASAAKSFALRLVVGQRDQNPCNVGEFTGGSVQELVVVFNAPTKSRFVRIDVINSPEQVSLSEIVIIGSPQPLTPFTEPAFIKYNFSIRDEMARSSRNLAGLAVEGSNVQFVFNHLWLTTPKSHGVVVRGDGFFPAGYRADLVPNKCLDGYGLAIPETSNSNRLFSFSFVNARRILRSSLRLLNMGINNTDGATEVRAQLVGFFQNKEVYRGRVVSSFYNASRLNWNPCTVPSHHLYLDSPEGAERVDLVLSHIKNGKEQLFSTEPVVIADFTYDLAPVDMFPTKMVVGTNPAVRAECINSQLVALPPVLGTEIKLNNVVISVSRSFTQNDLIVAEAGRDPAAYVEKNISNNCLGGAGVALRRTSTQPRLFAFDFGNKIVKSFSLVLVVGDEDPLQERQFTAQLVGLSGNSKTALSSLVEVNIANIRANRTSGCERGGRYRMVLQDHFGFSRVEFLTQPQSSKDFGSRVPIALSDICFEIDGVRTPSPVVSPVPQRVAHFKPFTPFGHCLSHELGEHSFDPTGLKVEGNFALPFRHLYINSTTSNTIVVQAGRLPAAYRVKGVPNDCLNGYGLGYPQTSKPALNQGFTFQFISGYQVKSLGLNLINFGNENVDKAQIVRAKMVGWRNGQVIFTTQTRSVPYESLRAGDWNPCTIPEGHSFYLEPGPQAFDKVDLLFEYSVDGQTFVPGTSEAVVISDICYDLFRPFDLPPAATEAPISSVPPSIPVSPFPLGKACVGTDMTDNKTSPIGQPISGPLAYAFSHLWINPLIKVSGNRPNTLQPIASRRGSQPAFHTIRGVPNECLSGPLAVGYTPNKHIELQGYDLKVVNGGAFTSFTFQYVSMENFDYTLKVRGLFNGQLLQEKTYPIRAVARASADSVCADATTWVNLASVDGFDAFELRLEFSSPLLSVNRAYLSSICYTQRG